MNSNTQTVLGQNWLQVVPVVHVGLTVNLKEDVGAGKGLSTDTLKDVPCGNEVLTSKRVTLHQQDERE